MEEDEEAGPAAEDVAAWMLAVAEGHVWGYDALTHQQRVDLVTAMRNNVDFTLMDANIADGSCTILRKFSKHPELELSELEMEHLCLAPSFDFTVPSKMNALAAFKIIRAFHERAPADRARHIGAKTKHLSHYVFLGFATTFLPRGNAKMTQELAEIMHLLLSELDDKKRSVQYKVKQVLKFLITEGKLSQIDAWRMYSFDVGANNVGALKDALDEGCDPNAVNEDGKMLYELASPGGKKLLMQRGFDPETKGSDGRTALLSADLAPQAGMTLLMYGADPNVTALRTGVWDKVTGFTMQQLVSPISSFVLHRSEYAHFNTFVAKLMMRCDGKLVGLFPDNMTAHQKQKLRNHAIFPNYAMAHAAPVLLCKFPVEIVQRVGQMMGIGLRDDVRNAYDDGLLLGQAIRERLGEPPEEDDPGYKEIIHLRSQDVDRFKVVRAIHASRINLPRIARAIQFVGQGCRTREQDVRLGVEDMWRAVHHIRRQQREIPEAGTGAGEGRDEEEDDARMAELTKLEAEALEGVRMSKTLVRMYGWWPAMEKEEEAPLLDAMEALHYMHVKQARLRVADRELSEPDAAQLVEMNAELCNKYKATLGKARSAVDMYEDADEIKKLQKRT